MGERPGPGAVSRVGVDIAEHRQAAHRRQRSRGQLSKAGTSGNLRVEGRARCGDQVGHVTLYGKQAVTQLGVGAGSDP